MRQSWLPEDGFVPLRDGAVPTEFRLDVAPERDAVRISPFGEIDLSTADQLRDEPQEPASAGVKTVILDLCGTTFLDSTGLRLVLDTYSAAAGDGIDLAIVAGPPSAQRAFEVSGLSGRLPFVDAGARRNGAG